MGSSEFTEKVGAHRETGPAYWIFLPAVLLSFYLLWMRSKYGMEEFVGVLGVSGLILSAGGIGLRWAGLRKAASVCAVIVLACYLTPLFLALFVLTIGRAAAFIWLAYLAVVLVPVGIFGVAATVSFLRSVGPRWAISAVVLGFIPSLALGVANLISEQSKYSNRPQAADPFVLKGDLLAIDKCSQQFAGEHSKDGYPTSLQQLGPDGTKCLSAERLNPARGEFTIVYVPGTRDREGKVESYSLRAQETNPRSEYRSTAYSTESGLEWYRFDGPSGPGQPALLYYPGAEFWTVMNCLWEGRRTGWSIRAGNPPTLSGRDSYLSRCVPNAIAASTDGFNLGRYRYVNKYRISVQDDSNVIGFEVSVRPVSYGDTGLRSYLAVGTYAEDGSARSLYVYATAKDRPATADDSLALAREVSDNVSKKEASWEWCGGQLCQ